MTTRARLLNSLTRLKTQTPLVYNITNDVVMNSTANALLAIGASPIMSDAIEETTDMVNIVNGLVVNIGTLTERKITTMLKASAHAREISRPWVLDPVGAGATPFRLQTSTQLLNNQPAVIRGNGSEILALCGEQAASRGVDSMVESNTLEAQAVQAARTYNTVIVITGATDIITDGKRIIRLNNGHPMMAQVTGTGCTASALVGAFLGIEQDPFIAAAAAIASLGVAGQLAAETSKGPGSLQVNLLDALYALDADTLDASLLMEEILWA